MNGHWDGIGEQIDAAGQDIARAALGIADGAEIRPFDVSKVALFVMVERDSNMATANATIPKREAVEILRYIADAWDQEWKTAEREAQKAARDRRGKS